MALQRALKLVSIGGGTGLSTLLAGLKPYLSPYSSAIFATRRIELTAIVTVTDDGKSSGRLRREFGVLPPGDVRNCLVALADDSHPLTAIFRHRFQSNGELNGHALGNLILVALERQQGDFLAAIDMVRHLLGVQSRVLPSTLDQVDLVARVGEKTTRGQIAIKSRDGSISQLALVPSNAQALPEAVAAILDADFITLGPGSLYTSVIANLLIEGIAKAVTASKAKKLYICNAMTEFDETHEFSALDHVQQLLAYAPGLRLDYALFNSTPISAEMQARYAAERAYALDVPALDAMPGIAFHARTLASQDRFVRHDPQRLVQAVLDLSGNLWAAETNPTPDKNATPAAPLKYSSSTPASPAGFAVPNGNGQRPFLI